MEIDNKTCSHVLMTNTLILNVINGFLMENPFNKNYPLPKLFILAEIVNIELTLNG